MLVREPLFKQEVAIPGEVCPILFGEDVVKNKNISVVNLTCKLNEQGEKYLLQDISFDVSEKSLTVITGQVGSGKSKLLAAIAGEVIQTSGSITCSGTIAYVSQNALVFSGTLRENVLFGERYDEKKYVEVIEACALREDINRFVKGDLSFVGEHGVALSGGQRARVSLARAVYADADVYLLDDPLSAVDAKVSEHIFGQCIGNLLRDKIVVLATYSENHMKAADQIVVLHRGSVLAKGSFQELRDERKILDSAIEASGRNSKKHWNDEIKDGQETTQSSSTACTDNFHEHLQISEEEKATGKISSALYWDYFKAGTHMVPLIAVVVLFLSSQGQFYKLVVVVV